MLKGITFRFCPASAFRSPWSVTLQQLESGTDASSSAVWRGKGKFIFDIALSPKDYELLPTSLREQAYIAIVPVLSLHPISKEIRTPALSSDMVAVLQEHVSVLAGYVKAHQIHMQKRYQYMNVEVNSFLEVVNGLLVKIESLVACIVEGGNSKRNDASLGHIGGADGEEPPAERSPWMWSKKATSTRPSTAQLLPLTADLTQLLSAGRVVTQTDGCVDVAEAAVGWEVVRLMAMRHQLPLDKLWSALHTIHVNAVVHDKRTGEGEGDTRNNMLRQYVVGNGGGRSMKVTPDVLHRALLHGMAECTMEEGNVDDEDDDVME